VSVLSSDEDITVFSENLLGNEAEEREELAEEETEEARKYVGYDSKIRAIIEGVVDGQTRLNRLAVTNNQVVFYPKGGFLASFQKTSAVFLDYDQIVAVQGRKGIVMGEISVSTKDRIIRFKDMAKDDVDQIANMISRLKGKASARAS
jgi:hypothetical protein